MAIDRKRYKLSPLAEADLEEIWGYTARRWSPAQARRYHSGIMAGLESLAAGATAGRPVDVRDGYLRYGVGAHVIFYRIGEAGIDVVRVLHERMDVNRHLH